MSSSTLVPASALRRARTVDGRLVVLIDPYWTRDKDPRVPLGHASLLAALRRAGVEVVSMPVAVNGAGADVARLADQVLAACRGRRPDEVDVAIGVYVWGEELVQALLRRLRAARFRGRVVLGGPQISYAGPGLEHLYPEADLFVRGYGEEALIAIARTPGRPLVAGVHVAGADDRHEQAAVDLGLLPSPWLDGVVPLDGQRFIRWETQRGCPFRCSFCQHREPGARLAYRRLARERVNAEIDLFCRSGVEELAVLDPIFNIGPESAAVLERFAAHGFRGRLELQCRAELIDDRFLDAAAPLDVCLELGLQTTNVDESKAVERKNDLGDIERALAGIRRRGLAHEVSLIFGLPGQTLASFISSVAWCLERGVPTIKAFPLLLLRGTKLERERDRWGYVDDGGPMAMALASNTFSRTDWEAMNRISQALKDTEGDHPTRIEDVLERADDLIADASRWQAPRNTEGRR